METGKQVGPGKRLSIAEAFAEIPEPRVAGWSKHDLVEMLVLAACAMVCGVDDFVGIEAWGNEWIDWLRRIVKLENGIPSHDTLGRLFGLLDRRAVEQSFRHWVGSVLPGLAVGSVVAIDGKASFDRRLYIGSIAPDAAVLANAVRAHWGIENSVHWCFDVALNDDQMCAHIKNAGANLAIIRHLVLNLFLLDTSKRKSGIHTRRILAASSDSYRANLLGLEEI
jgi:predicted transposase YbfD/YdcC